MSRHWLNRERLRLYPLAAFIVYLGWVCVLLARSRHGVYENGLPIGFDFIAFWGAARMALSGNPVGAYDLQALVKVQQGALPGLHEGPLGPWQYPPSFLMLVLPLGLMPYLWSYLVFIGASFAGLAAVMRRLFRQLDLPADALWLPLLGFPAVMINAFEGQNGFLTGALVCAALLLLPRRPAWAGVAIGLLSIKPQLGLLLPLALACGGFWRTLLYALFTAAGLTVVSIALFGTDTLLAFFERLPEVASWVSTGKMPLGKMPTVFAYARLLGLPAPAAFLVHGLVALAVAGLVGWCWLRCKDWALRSAALLAGTMLASPYLYDYDLVWLAPALACFCSHALRVGWLPGERELLVAVWLLPGLMLLFWNLLAVQPAPFVLIAFLLTILRRVALAHKAGGA